MRIDGGNYPFGKEFYKEIQRMLNGEANNQSLQKMKSEIERQTRELQKLDNEVIQEILEEIRRKLDYLNKYLKIEIDDQLEIPVVKIIEKETNKVIRQIPPEYLLELMKRIDMMLGVLLSERA